MDIYLGSTSTSVPLVSLWSSACAPHVCLQVMIYVTCRKTCRWMKKILIEIWKRERNFVFLFYSIVVYIDTCTSSDSAPGKFMARHGNHNIEEYKLLYSLPTLNIKYIQERETKQRFRQGMIPLLPCPGYMWNADYTTKSWVILYYYPR